MSEGRQPSPRQAQLLALAAELRPQLHRYCARLMGSVIEGEDVVQDTFARAFVAIDEMEEAPPLRAWLFRVAHNRALDLIRARAIRAAEPLEAAHEIAGADDPEEMLMRREAVNTAVSRFVELPTVQRSVVILKDVLDQSLEEIAALLDLTINAVKAHLARGRAKLKAINAAATAKPAPRAPSLAVVRYIDLFNRHDWDGLRAMLADDVRLIQSTYPVRAGAADVGMFFGIYSRSAPARLVPAWLEGREVIAVYEYPQSPKPSYIMWLEWSGEKISFIRDYKYVRYVIDDAELVLALDTTFSGDRRDESEPGHSDLNLLARNVMEPFMEFAIIARFHAREENEEAVAAALRAQVPKTRSEPGCLQIGAYASPHDPRLFFIHSRWRDEAAFEIHAQLPNTVQFVEQMEKLIDHPFDATRTRAIA